MQMRKGNCEKGYCANCPVRREQRDEISIFNNYPAKSRGISPDSRRGRRPSWLNQGIFRKIELDNFLLFCLYCFIIQQILIDYYFQKEKNYGSMMKTLKASNTLSLINIKTKLQEIEVFYRSLEKTYLQTHVWK